MRWSYRLPVIYSLKFLLRETNKSSTCHIFWEKIWKNLPEEPPVKKPRARRRSEWGISPSYPGTATDRWGTWETDWYACIGPEHCPSSLLRGGYCTAPASERKERDKFADLVTNSVCVRHVIEKNYTPRAELVSNTFYLFAKRRQIYDTCYIRDTYLFYRRVYTRSLNRRFCGKLKARDVARTLRSFLVEQSTPT